MVLLTGVLKACTHRQSGWGGTAVVPDISGSDSAEHTKILAGNLHPCYGFCFLAMKPDRHDLVEKGRLMGKAGGPALQREQRQSTV